MATFVLVVVEPTQCAPTKRTRSSALQAARRAKLRAAQLVRASNLPADTNAEA
jgi:hypothetical protein